jgi:predicted nucleic acid-binding protein
MDAALLDTDILTEFFKGQNSVVRGHAHRDADLIIAATAIEHGRTLVTGNTSHFQWVPGLQIDNWR